jgi:hypothetical protein
VAWDLQALKVRRGAEEKTLAEARQAGWMEDFAWGWDQAAGQYVFIYDSSIVPGVADQLEPWKSYWVRAYVDCELILPPPPPQGAASRQQRAEDPPRAADGRWTVRLVALADGKPVETVVMGVTPRLVVPPSGGHEALTGTLRTGWQVGRPPEPPTGAAPTQAYFVDAAGQPLVVDLRQGTVAPQEWDYVVATRTGAAGSIVLTWPELGRTGPRDVSFTLVDLTTGKRQSLRTTGAYTYRPSRGEAQRRFQILVEPGHGTPLQITALQSTVTRGPEGAAQIAFQLTRSAVTEVTITTLAGRVVSGVERDQTRAAGLHQVVWPGRDEEGRPVPPGLYLVQVTATDEEGRQVQAVRTVRMP